MSAFPLPFLLVWHSQLLVEESIHGLVGILSKFHYRFKVYEILSIFWLFLFKYGWLLHKESSVFLNFGQNYSRIAYILMDDLLCFEAIIFLMSPSTLLLQVWQGSLLAL
jgi:hypothetical protein